MFDHNATDYKKYIKLGGARERTVLVRLEPPAIFPRQYTKFIESQYAKIYTPGSILNIESPDQILGWVHRYDPNPVEPRREVHLEANPNETMDSLELLNKWKNREIPISMVAANKVSPIASQNYEIRRKIASQLDQELLSVYGPLWNDSYLRKMKHRAAVAKFALSQKTVPNPISIYGGLHKKFVTTKGSIPDKHKVMRNSKFCIVVENSNSYFSEKLFDALYDGAIPLYIGPEIKKFFPSNNIGINVSGDPNEIRDIVSSITENEILEILLGGRKFLSSSNFKNNWTEKGVYKRISNEILKKWAPKS
jgi:hypothetical protein